MKYTQIIRNKKIFSWALYDWANSAYATTIMAVFFPLFFKDYWAVDLPVEKSTFILGAANSIVSVIIFLLAPLLGAMADIRRNKKKFIFYFTLMGAAASILLAFCPYKSVFSPAVFYIFGSLGFSGAIVFYDALLPGITDSKNYDTVSSFAYALGYAGGGGLFLINVLFTLFPEFWGFEDISGAIKFSFITVGVWWVLFSVPLFKNIKEGEGQKNDNYLFLRSIKHLKKTVGKIMKFRDLKYFFLAYWLYIDGVDTIVRMAMDYGKSINLDNNGLIIAFIVVQFVAVPGSLAMGVLGDKYGPKKVVSGGIIVYLIVVVFAFFMNSIAEFYVMAVLIGLVQGGIQSLSRSLFSRLIPKENSAEYFGFYNLLGKFAVIIGPFLMGAVSLIFHHNRMGIVSLAVIFILGFVFLQKVDFQRDQAPNLM